MVNINLIPSAIHRVSAQLRSVSTIRFIILFSACSILLSKILMIGLSMIGNEFNVPETITQRQGFWEAFFFGVVLAPFFETLIIQHLPFRILRKRLAPIFIILFSAIGFSLTHQYSASYMIVAFAIGLIYAYAYFLKLGRYPILIVTLIHALHNGIALTIQILIEWTSYPMTNTIR